MKGRVIAAVVAAVLIILGVTIAAVSLDAVGWNFRRLNTVRVQEHKYPVNETFDSIDIRVKDSDVRLFPSPDGTCYVVSYQQENMPIRVSVVAGHLQIYQEDERQWYDHITFLGGGGYVGVALPEEIYEHLNIEVRTGDVHVRETFQFRSAYAVIGTGDMDFAAETTENLGLRVGTGDIKAAAGGPNTNVTLTVGTGDVSVKDMTCWTMGINGGTGDVHLERVISTSGLQVKTSTGDVRLNLCDARTINVETSTGDVTGILLNDKIFRAHASTGDVDVPTNGTDGVCEINTSTGDIRIKVNKNVAGMP